MPAVRLVGHRRGNPGRLALPGAAGTRPSRTGSADPGCSHSAARRECSAASRIPLLWSGRGRRRRWHAVAGAGPGWGTRSTESWWCGIPAGEAGAGLVGALVEREQRGSGVAGGADRLVGQDRQRAGPRLGPRAGGQRLVAAILWMTSRRSRVAPATLAIGTGAGIVLGVVMYAVAPLGLGKAATNPWLPGSDIDSLVVLAWILLLFARWRLLF